MIKFSTKWAFIVWLVSILFISGCDRPYLSGLIEIDFQNTTWYLEHEENLGSIYIKENGKFCIDKPLAEKMYYKNIVDSFGKKEICGKFFFDKEFHQSHFGIRSTDFGASDTGVVGTVLRVPPKGIHFIVVGVMSNGQREEGILLQKQ